MLVYQIHYKRVSFILYFNMTKILHLNMIKMTVFFISRWFRNCLVMSLIMELVKVSYYFSNIDFLCTCQKLHDRDNGNGVTSDKESCTSSDNGKGNIKHHEMSQSLAHCTMDLVYWIHTMMHLVHWIHVVYHLTDVMKTHWTNHWPIEWCLIFLAMTIAKMWYSQGKGVLCTKTIEMLYDAEKEDNHFFPSTCVVWGDFFQFRFRCGVHPRYIIQTIY